VAAMAPADNLGPDRTGPEAGRPPPRRRRRVGSGPAAGVPARAADDNPADDLVASHGLAARRLARADPDADARIDGAATLARSVAHEFNNVLAAVLGNLQLLRRRVGEDKVIRRMVDPAIDAALRGSDLTRRLLAYAHRRDLEPQSLDVNAAVAAMEGAIVRTAGPDIEVSFDFADHVPKVETDPAHLEAAILSLAANARDAMPEGGALAIGTAKVVIDGTVAARPPALKSGAYACITVKDTGYGMDTELVECAFDPFFSTKSGDCRSGLGLSLVAGFVRQSRGHVTVTSAPTHGTRFRIFLPAAERPARQGSGRAEAVT